ncbi:DUF4440 domain-containing protein [uncultured Fibrella sp.]|uniref:DUF4440 domain-containing protein n=1 Tax=uncultured Fibrella sp. TaxID=1284596 RepID=UPI0035C9C130
MKTLFLPLVLAAIAVLPFPQTAFAQKADEVAQIKAVVERETKAWAARDAAAFADCWANVPEASTLVVLADEKHTIVHSQNTKQDMPTSSKTLIASMGKPTGETFQNTDYVIRVKGDAAFAQYNQTVTAPDGQKQYAHETRYLEKMGGKWKIVHVGAAFYTPAN